MVAFATLGDRSRVIEGVARRGVAAMMTAPGGSRLAQGFDMSARRQSIELAFDIAFDAG